MDKVVQKLVAMGVPGLILLGIAATTGLSGGAALVTALAFMGGPFGMVGGAVALAALALAVDAISEYGFESVASKVVKGLKCDGLSREEIIKEINSYRLLSKNLKDKIVATV